jgi:hypothetical protein
MLGVIGFKSTVSAPLGAQVEVDPNSEHFHRPQVILRASLRRVPSYFWFKSFHDSIKYSWLINRSNIGRSNHAIIEVAGR